ncbi:4Fe-4S dicluster domain-containing protein [Pseudorhodoplanes sp.]|uniref:4Fe-4S dicluster domain-containing protein n=1 Tax=Pseudorhodoplanes sp. TaxID=1934341 RepID=UPI003D11F575
MEVGIYPSTARHFQVTRCNQCESPPCVYACPTSAMFRRPDGIVDFDREACIGCKACMAACPYDAIYINPDNHSAEKCNFCTHRIDRGMEPACVVVCPTQALIVGNLNDPTNEVSMAISKERTNVRRPEKATSPKVFYIGASQFTLDATIPERRGSTATSQHAAHREKKDSSRPDKTFAAALMAYGSSPRAPWDWRVSAYSWTKAISTGLLFVLAVLLLSGVEFEMKWHLAGSLLSGVFLALTSAFLVSDLSHPLRFYYIITRPQWRSWLARGAFILIGFGICLAVYVIAVLLEDELLLKIVAWVASPIALLGAVYTAFLLGESKGRDLWQNPLLPALYAAEAIAAGAAVLAMLGLVIDTPTQNQNVISAILACTALISGCLALSELIMPHPTRQAALAAAALTKGPFALLYWASILLIAAGAAFALAGMLTDQFHYASAGGFVVAVGLLSHTHAYIQAGQYVPQS